MSDLVTVSQYTATVKILNFSTETTLETSTEITCTLTSHGLSTGDFIVNTTRRSSSQLQAERGSRKITVIDNDTFTVSPEISGQTTSDTVSIFTWDDKTEFLLDGSLSINFRPEGQNEANFILKTLFTPDAVVAGKGYIYGGIFSSSLQDTDEFDNDADSWTNKTDMPTPARRSLSASTIAGKGYIYCGFSPSRDCDEYDSDGDSWANKTDAPAPDRAFLGASTIESKGYIYFGSDSGTRNGDCDEFDSSGNSWASKTDLPSPTRDVASACTVDTKGYIVGGEFALDDTDEFNASGNSWTSKTDITAHVSSHASSEIGSKAYVYGGDRSADLAECKEYDTDGDSWASKTDMPSPAREKLGASTIGDKGYIYGGLQGLSKIADCDEFNASGNSWASMSNLPSPSRSELSASTIS